MFRLIKLLFWAVFIVVVLSILTGYKIKGKTVVEHGKEISELPMFKEGIRDLRTLLGEGLKTAGEAITDNVPESDKKQLDNLVKQELKDGKPVEGTPSQQTLPPITNPKAPSGKDSTLINKIDNLINSTK